MDCFALLGLRRAPWVDPEQLQSAFLTLSNQHHPDRFQNAAEKAGAEKRFTDINAANQTLRSNSLRLAHLLELETGSKTAHVQEIPPEAMSFFDDVAKITRGLDKFLAEEKPEGSSMLNVYHFERALEWTEIVQELQTRLSVQIATLESELKTMNRAWETAPPSTGHSSSQARVNSLPIPRLRVIASAMAFLEKWNSQLQEKIARLALVT
mgnify:CR=1 FL=1